MKKLLAFIAILFAMPAVLLSAKNVKSLKLNAVTRTEKVIIDIEGENKSFTYLTPRKNYNYTILDYDFNPSPDNNSYVFTGTLVDIMLNTATEVTVYSNGTFTEMRIGKQHPITFTYVSNFSVKE